MRQYIMELMQLSLFPDIVNQKTSDFLWVRSWTYFLISWTKSVYYKKYFLKVYIFLFMFKVITGQVCFHLLSKKIGWEKFKPMKYQHFPGLICLQNLKKNFYWEEI